MDGFTSDDDDTPDQVRVYEIHADREVELAARIAKANRRLARAGCADQFTYAATPFLHQSTNSAGMIIAVPMLHVTLSAPRITAPGYTFMAALTQEEGGMIVRTAPGQSLGGWTRPQSHDCHYCHKHRRRSTSYVVRHDTTGDILQIGKSCLTPFLGISPAGLWTLEMNAEDLLPEGSDEHYFGGHVPIHYPIRELLAMALAVSEDGKKFITAAQGRDRQQSSTASLTMFVWHWRPTGSKSDAQDRPYVEAMRAAARAVPVQRIEEVLAVAATLDTETDYGANMVTALAGQTVSSKSVALVVSLIAAHNRILRTSAAAQADSRARIVDEWLGQPKDKLTDLDVIIEAVMFVDGYAYNSTDTVVVMRTADGHVLKWKASGRHDEIELGAAYRLDRATVKDHRLYRDIKQTVVTRCKLSAVTVAA